MAFSPEDPQRSFVLPRLPQLRSPHEPFYPGQLFEFTPNLALRFSSFRFATFPFVESGNSKAE